MKLFKTYIYVFCLLLSISTKVYSQNDYQALPDSLQSVINNNSNDDFSKIESLIYVCDILMDLREYNMIKPLADELMILSEKNNYLYGITISDYFLSAHFLNIDNYSTSIEHLTDAYSRVYDLEDNENKSILMVRILLALSVYYHRISMLPQALENIHKAMEINDSLNIFRYKVIAINNLAGIYADIDNPTKSITMLKPLLKDENLTKQHDFLINLNIGVLYSREDKTDSALIYFNNARESVNTNKDEMTLLYMIGNSYLRKGDIDTALDYLHKSISVENALNNPDTYALSVIRIAALHSQMGRNDSALYYVDKVIDNISALSLKCNGLATKANILKESGKYEECIDVLTEYVILTDSLNNIKNVSKTSQMIFDYEKKQELMRAEIDNYILQAQYNKEKNRLIILTISSLMGIIIVLLLFSRNKIILKNKKESEAALKDQLELRNKELTTKVMLQLQKNEVIEEIIKIITDINKNEQNKHNIKQITKKLRLLKANSSWSDFDYGFIKVHQNFYDKLLNDFPDLTLSERRLCALIKLNLNTKEIASITNLSPDSVRVARTRLRKKLNLTYSDMPLSTFLANY